MSKATTSDGDTKAVGQSSDHGSVLPDGWEMVIGLEVHAELATKSKMFSPAANEFGAEPNTNVHPVCLGLPGTLPVVNEKAVEHAARIGLALNCTVQRCIWARKNYFYPDMPKDYQISQYDLPLNIDGSVELPSGFVVTIERAHMEEDTGKSTHIGESGRIHDAGYSLVDYNRAGVPLIEIVTGPDLQTPQQAREYVQELHDILVTIGASDGKMEEGSMRVDANVSVRPAGADELRTRCEVKNVNSLRSMVRAIEYEAKRHVALYEAGEKPRQETRHWDEAAGRTRAGRSKENEDGYRYFPDPDLVPIDPTPEWLAELKASLPVLPRERRVALVERGVSMPAAVVAVSKNLDELANATIDAGADSSKVMKHIEQNLAAGSADNLTAEYFAELIRMESASELSSTQTKQVLAEMATTGNSPASIAAAHGFEAMDTSELEAMLDGVIAENPQEWERFVAGDAQARGKLQGFFTGQIMRLTKGQADGKIVNQLLLSRADG